VDSDAFGKIIVGRLFEDGWRRGSARCLSSSLFHSLFQNVGCSGNMLNKDSLKEYQVANLDTSNTPTGWNAKYQYPRVCTLLFSVNWNRLDLSRAARIENVFGGVPASFELGRDWQ
jgi:hypothetical protein